MDNTLQRYPKWSAAVHHCTSPAGQNTPACLVLGLSRSDQVRPAFKELHWLPVVHRIKFKLALVMFTIHTHHCPDYLTDSVHGSRVMVRHDIDSARRPAPTSLLYSTYKDEIWWQSFLCGQASRVEQFTSSSLSRRQFAFF